jgi:predicted metal-dependent peptidase
MAVTKLDRAKAAIVLDHPFFASILLKRPLIEDNTIPTAAVDQRGQIYYNKDFVENLTVPELVFLLAHEVGHVIGQHSARLGSRDHKKWNIAGDAWINDMLAAAKVGQTINGGVDMPGSKDRTVDEIYNELPDSPNGPGGAGDDLIQRGAPVNQQEAEAIAAQVKVDVAQAAQAAKVQGKMPAALQEIIDGIIHVKTPWYEILEQYMTSMVKGDYTWMRPNRRFIGQGHYLPSTGSVPEMGEIVIQVDVSGSISKAEIDHYNGHLARILEQCNPERVHVLYTDTQVQRHDTFERGNEFSLTFMSGGGTDMEAGFEYLDKQGLEPEVFVCLTDGYTAFNQSSKPAYDVVWCISSDVEAPYGTNVHFELEKS